MVIALIGEMLSEIVIRLTRLQNKRWMAEMRCLLQAEAAKAFGIPLGKEVQYQLFIAL